MEAVHPYIEDSFTRTPFRHTSGRSLYIRSRFFTVLTMQTPLRSIRISDELWEALKLEAAAKGTTRAQLIKTALMDAARLKPEIPPEVVKKRTKEFVEIVERAALSAGSGTVPQAPDPAPDFFTTPFEECGHSNWGKRDDLSRFCRSCGATTQPGRFSWERPE